MSSNMLFLSVILFMIQMGIVNTQNPAQIDDTRGLFAHFSKFYMSNDWSDCFLFILGERVPAHRVMLLSHSQYFRNVFNDTDLTQVKGPNVPIISFKNDPFDFKPILRYLYTGKLNLIPYNVQETVRLMSVAQKYGFQHLLVALEEVLIFEVDTWNVIGLRKIAKMHRLERLTESIEKYLDVSIGVLFDRRDHLVLSYDDFYDLVSRPVTRATMLQKFNGVAKWLQEHENNNETINRAALMDNIDLHYISSLDIIEYVRPTNLYPQQFLFDHLASRDIKPSTPLTTPTDTIDILTPEHTLNSGFTPDGQKVDMLIFESMIEVNALKFTVNEMKNRTYFSILTSTNKLEWKPVFSFSQIWENRMFQIFFEIRDTTYIKVEGNFNITNYGALRVPTFIFDKGYVTPPFSAMNQARFINAVPMRFNAVLKPLKRGFNSSLPYQAVGSDFEIFFTFLQPYWIQQCLMRVIEITNEASAVELTLYDEHGVQAETIEKEFEDGWVDAEFGLQIVSKIGVKARFGKDYRFVFFTVS